MTPSATATATGSVGRTVAFGARSAEPSPSATLRTPQVTRPTSETTATGPQHRVGDGVVPDPSIAPEAEATESEADVTDRKAETTQRTASPKPATSALPKTFDPKTIRATRGQDPLKAGALHLDGTQVRVAGLRPQYDRHGGLASTGW